MDPVDLSFELHNSNTTIAGFQHGLGLWCGSLGLRCGVGWCGIQVGINQFGITDANGSKLMDLCTSVHTLRFGVRGRSHYLHSNT
jgi:hypothetical protein